MDERIGRPVNALCETQSRSDAHLLVGLVGTVRVADLSLEIARLVLDEILHNDKEISVLGRSKSDRKSW